MSSNEDHIHDVIIVGAGFAGVYGLHRMRNEGLDVMVVEAGDDVGGTWYWNRYPGLRCDVDSLEYCYAFSDEIQQEWTWKERYAPQKDIHEYIRFVADRLDLRKDIRFETRIASATFDRDQAVWTLESTEGKKFRARYCTLATGCLSIPKTPDIEGIDEFGGELIHSVQWPDEPLELADKSVAVIGTGSTGVQMIPLLAKEAKQLTVVQRTPAFCTPARNQPWSEGRLDYWRKNFRELRETARNTRAGVLHEYGMLPASAHRKEDIEADLERRWLKGGPNVLYGFNDLLVNEETNDLVANFLRSKIAEAVDDPETAKKLTPWEYPVGAKRICVGTDYYETYNRDNVTLIDLRSEKLERIEKDGIRTDAGFYPVDLLILATGYDAMTGAVLAMDIRNEKGESIRDAWSGGPETYMGYGIAGFPNMFLVTGPGSPSVFSNMVLSVEHDMDWITDCVLYLNETGAKTIETDPDAQTAWMEHVDELASQTLVNKAASWYRGANVAGKPQKFMPYLGGVNSYQDRCREVAQAGYEGFLIDGEDRAANKAREMADG